ncbi:PHB depolymerase family esterase [Ruegeria sp. 2205SS24-7]|uniref:alpha/beta hydrolase family esterase n=1 Tax=Ruegeria discodermiae TaxID=3064389 RepID=UPI002741A2A6|nr:PHB depolymerase family esterase [Ruegeria sp. 2205SS24-7]MDP5216922.1 PHB depolymerase family esterase [Ruegeria sp. 2205SS24-7]
MIRAIGLCLALSWLGQGALAGCGDLEGACEIDTGIYHIELPDTPKESMPAVIFLHGYGGSGQGVLKMRGMVEGFKARGYAVIAPSGEPRNGDGPRSWVFYPGWEGRDELGFLQDVRADASARFGIDPDRTILSGFSGGGFMVYYLACDTPDAFAAYASVAGGFWRPHPEACAGPIRLFHTHGWTDNVVPLEGRELGGGRFRQGDIFAGLEIWRAANECVDNRPDGFSETGQFMRRKWTRCVEGSALEFALFPGGHQIPQGWADMIVDWAEGLPGS